VCINYKFTGGYLVTFLAAYALGLSKNASKRLSPEGFCFSVGTYPVFADGRRTCVTRALATAVLAPAVSSLPES
jgi:hypothetical protein